MATCAQRSSPHSRSCDTSFLSGHLIPALCHLVPLTAPGRSSPLPQWYKDTFLTPHMATAYFAIDAQTSENGALTVLNGSHSLGRVDHWTRGDQQGADLERVEIA